MINNFIQEKQKLTQKNKTENKTIILSILTHLQLSFSNIHQDRQCRNNLLNVQFFQRVFDNFLRSVLVRAVDGSE